jgi:hypothetical protein
MKIDGKYTAWQRIEINDAEAEKSLLEFIAENPSVGFSDIYDWAVKNGISFECETLDGTEAEMTLFQNENFSTIEIHDQYKVIWQNGESANRRTWGWPYLAKWQKTH